MNFSCDPALSGLCYGSSRTHEEFCRILDKTISIMAPDEINASMHTHIKVDNRKPHVYQLHCQIRMYLAMLSSECSVVCFR